LEKVREKSTVKKSTGKKKYGEKVRKKKVREWGASMRDLKGPKMILFNLKEN
jgi:hypothetical protein